MKIRNLLISVAAATTLMCSALVHAAPGDLKRSDRNFFEKAAKSGMKEVAVSEAALPKLPAGPVQEFARMMVSDHLKANEELKALAARKGVTLPPPEHKYAEKWNEKTKDVTDDYLKLMVDDHQEAVALFEDAAKSEDADIAAFAQKTLPALRHHLDTVKNLKKVN